MTHNISPLRPWVAASSRLSCWTTPFAIERRASTIHLLCSEAYERLLEVSVTSLAPNTQRAYASSLLRFTQFCDNHKVSEDLRMPASSELLAARFWRMLQRTMCLMTVQRIGCRAYTSGTPFMALLGMGSLLRLTSWVKG